jgi:hypothetical protein
VEVLVAASAETNGCHCVVERLLRGRRLENEVDVFGVINAGRVDRSTSTASKNGSDTCLPKGVRDGDGDGLEARPGGEFQRRFPALRGRRRSRPTRFRSSSSPSASRAIYARNSS